jgi:hypothetical protein
MTAVLPAAVLEFEGFAHSYSKKVTRNVADPGPFLKRWSRHSGHLRDSSRAFTAIPTPPLRFVVNTGTADSV